MSTSYPRLNVRRKCGSERLPSSAVHILYRNALIIKHIITFFKTLHVLFIFFYFYFYFFLSDFYISLLIFVFSYLTPFSLMLGQRRSITSNFSRENMKTNIVILSNNLILLKPLNDAHKRLFCLRIALLNVLRIRKNRQSFFHVSYYRSSRVI